MDGILESFNEATDLSPVAELLKYLVPREYPDLSEVHSLIKKLPIPSDLKTRCPDVAIILSECISFWERSDDFESLLIECLTSLFEDQDIDPLLHGQRILFHMICHNSIILESVITKWPCFDVNSPVEDFRGEATLPIDLAIENESYASAVILLRNFSKLPQSNSLARVLLLPLRNKEMLELFLILTYLNFWHDSWPRVNCRVDVADRLVDPSTLDEKIYSEPNLIRSVCIAIRKGMTNSTRKQILDVISTHPEKIQSLLKLSQVSVENLELKPLSPVEYDSDEDDFRHYWDDNHRSHRSPRIYHGWSHESLNSGDDYYDYCLSFVDD